MGTRPRVTVSVVLYRDYKTPLRMVEGLFRFTDPSLGVRVYAVDNSAPDSAGLGEERDAFVGRASSLGNLEYVDAGGNLGFGAANNLALSRAGSEYHAFVNPDVEFVGDALSVLAAFMDGHPEAGMCVPRVVGPDGSPQRVYWRDPSVLDALNRTLLGNRLKARDRYYTMAGEDYSRPFRVPFAQGSFLFGRTALLKGLGGFDERFFMYLEDADLCRRVNGVSELLYCPDATVVHRWERGSRRDPRLFREHLKSYARYFRKWGLRLA